MAAKDEMFNNSPKLLIGGVVMVVVIFFALRGCYNAVFTSDEPTAREKRVTQLKDMLAACLAYTQDKLVKGRLNYPLTAKFSDNDWGIEDTDKGIVSCSGKYQASNAFGVPSGGTFFAIFKIDTAGRDSLIAFKIR